MERPTCTVIIPTNSEYLDVCEILVKILDKYWKECPYKKIISYYGEKQHIDFCESIYNGPTETLTNCIKIATQQCASEYYICLLGDAYFCSEFKQETLDEILGYMDKNRINYCSLKPTKKFAKEKKASIYTRYINSRDRYGFSFISFICTPKFVEEEFGAEITDRDFEIKYLTLASNKSKSFYFRDAISVSSNVFNIYPGIVKGKWNRYILYKLKRKNKDIDFGHREKLGVWDTLYVMFADFFGGLLPLNIVRRMKRIYKMLTKVDIMDM